jgi:hypothetical protein
MGKVLVEHIVSVNRGLEYAIKVNLPEVWSRLAKAQLEGLRIKDSIGQCPTPFPRIHKSELLSNRFVHQSARPVEFLRGNRDRQPCKQA